MKKHDWSEHHWLGWGLASAAGVIGIAMRGASLTEIAEPMLVLMALVALGAVVGIVIYWRGNR